MRKVVGKILCGLWLDNKKRFPTEVVPPRALNERVMFSETRKVNLMVPDMSIQELIWAGKYKSEPQLSSIESKRFPLGENGAREVKLIHFEREIRNYQEVFFNLNRRILNSLT